ncbi:unnamed protein product [Brachionus calyciflorus]|uniref:Integrase catalytic domain-containing protein n=1 Tax=Brachionus calyciflorus TaxID=104777 RepID=A0A814H414_9BILA|nr:unnamed protein product [Brachionus calyciflorus]
MNKLNEIKANSVTDLTDPNQKPITTKSRPLPYHLKQKVREELDRQLKAGIIRKSKSEWSVALRIVDKKDGSIRMRDITTETVAKLLLNEWFCKYGIPEGVLSDQGTQFQSKFLDLIYEYLEIKRLKTTAYHPQCDRQSERTVQTVKNMIKSYKDDEQLTWDENLPKYAYAYNSSVHETTKHTPFKLMFGRKPKIPIDLILPNLSNLNREPLLKKYTTINEHGQIDVLADPAETIEKNIPIIATDYLNELKETMNEAFMMVTTNRNIRMNKAKVTHDRKIRKTEYKIGDLVLTDHPELKNGLSSGIAHKYYGPFEIVCKNPNNIDYFIKKWGSKKSKIKQVHISRLKTFYHNLTEISQTKTDVDPLKPVSSIKKSTKQNKTTEHSSSNSDESVLVNKPKKNCKTRKIFTKKIYTDSESNTSENETLSLIKQKIKNNTRKRNNKRKNVEIDENKPCTSSSCDNDVVLIDLKNKPKTDSEEEFQPILKMSKPLSISELVEQNKPPLTTQSFKNYSMNEFALRCQIDVLHDILAERNKVIERQEKFIDRNQRDREECGDLLIQLAKKFKAKPEKPYKKPERSRHAQSQGLVEQANGTMEKMIASMMGQFKTKDCGNFLPRIILSLNCDSESPLRLRNRIIPKKSKEKGNFSQQTLEQLAPYSPLNDERANDESSSSDSDADSSDYLCANELTCDHKEFLDEKVSKTSKGKPLLIVGEDQFILEKKNKEKIYWRCNYSSYKKGEKTCKIRLHTDLNKKPLFFTKKSHNYDLLDPEELECKILVNEIKERAKQTTEHPRTFIANALTNLPRSSGQEQLIKQDRGKMEKLIIILHL